MDLDEHNWIPGSFISEISWLVCGGKSGGVDSQVNMMERDEMR